MIPRGSIEGFIFGCAHLSKMEAPKTMFFLKTQFTYSEEYSSKYVTAAFRTNGMADTRKSTTQTVSQGLNLSSPSDQVEGGRHIWSSRKDDASHDGSSCQESTKSMDTQGRGGEKKRGEKGRGEGILSEGGNMEGKTKEGESGTMEEKGRKGTSQEGGGGGKPRDESGGKTRQPIFEVEKMPSCETGSHFGVTIEIFAVVCRVSVGVVGDGALLGLWLSAFWQ
ncbi:glycine-rich protein [Planoprotostelium fungivorum]|uniref:Glycine-rich protein n=1 Tax=Planoprotostelium fungivorum TaxID=1890364 RepID=A0A2P6MV80_9EUKA|nr:glycine-rich protein [Planoprotostelium fungivorum]